MMKFNAIVLLLAWLLFGQAMAVEPLRELRKKKKKKSKKSKKSKSSKGKGSSSSTAEVITFTDEVIANNGFPTGLPNGNPGDSNGYLEDLFDPVTGATIGEAAYGCINAGLNPVAPSLFNELQICTIVYTLAGGTITVVGAIPLPIVPEPIIPTL